MGAIVTKTIPICALLLLTLPGVPASAAELKDLIGKWRWQQSTIEVSECQRDGICAKVVAGPKNVGMELLASKLIAKDGNLVGQIVHPETKDIYNTRFQQKDKDAWRLDGCTASRVCLSGEFARVK